MVEELHFMLNWASTVITNLGSGVIIACLAVALLGILLGLRK